MNKVQWLGRSPGLLALCTAMMLWPAAARAAGDVQDVNQLKTELQAQRQRQADLEDKINQLEARQKLKEQKLKERKLDQKVEQVAAQQEKKEEPKEEGKKKETEEL